MNQLAVILPAAGSSTRFGSGRSKLLEKVFGKTVLARSIEAFGQRQDVSLIVIPSQPSPQETTSADEIQSVVASYGGVKGKATIQLCAGGANRGLSVLAALREVPISFEWVAIHDAARPLVSQELIDRVFAAARQYGAAAPALPIPWTVKKASGPLPARVEMTIPRQSLWAMQTPQIVRRADLLAAYNACPVPLDQVTDDVQLLELAGQPVWLVPGEDRNLKITTQFDLKIAELLATELDA